jgi:alpha-galactosidase
MPALSGDGGLAHFNTWTSMDADVNEARLLDAVDRVAGQGLRYFMLDAGWYPCPSDDFNAGVGNWRVDTAKFPRPGGRGGTRARQRHAYGPVVRA